ncbi:hypothetical protein COCMIDRAFT_111359 [Bipolaris oryzae ATCC 44560]|uniref:RING-type domain-containing protein n=1 Tax=Bipolaris oryzae ATCC 44560 TaxID=930090 RepID=W6YJH1_COCMI|nr:uncharacterized protein COCMIDRAFT_111359 [Bipolaris oryzae ATCC 44560]EUC39517.1 hypothetical protein COCMIDRAFT_111359 [Bipolaris oryzae ATCC 44560]
MTLNISRHLFVDSDTRSRQQWCPKDVLDLCGDDRCVGYAPSKGRKCHARIAYWSRSTMESIMDDMSQQPPDPTILRPQLEHLASYGLCVRYHQRQIDSMVRKWSSKIYAAFPTGRAPVSNLWPSNMTASSISSTTPPQLENLRDMIQETMRCTNELLEIVSNNHPPVQTISMASTSVSEISSPAPSRRSSIPSDSSEDTAISSTSDSAESTRQTTTPPISTSPIPRTATPSSVDDTTELLPSSRPSPQPQPCTRPHARLILLSDPCPICHEGGPLSSSPATDLVWCKSSCGRPVHKSCFEAWRTQRENDGEDPTCVICRADWDDECDCQGCHHVPRRSGDTACAICLDGLDATSEAEEGGTVWCKDGCGKSVHKTCFEVWQGHCADAGRDATCVMCRAAWNTDCSC